ncbi:hypothetical protein OEZ85_002495 [Tetradesmus obliquus]|uniref:Tryptophan synthase beta chain-like PALP domain-containing protein n=1 Tax=Tetradesmus obliquus TaxID=3088 RepID=A0ABY8TY72_TETOB|nr:hypothetical protein OEZ85_002495 [Tetradesmus obliquus]
MAAVTASHSSFLQLQKYQAPEWASALKLVPSTRYRLGLLPTPIHRWPLPNLPPGTEVWVKRDDLSGMQLSGNKVRKLEFLMAEAVAQQHDCVITIGGIQSNHARATAVAATYLGLPCHLILRNSRALADSDPGLVGNLLVERLVGATIHQVSKEEYARLGATRLGAALSQQLQQQGKKPYYIPVGGSSALGCWGYLNAAEEIAQQQEELGLQFDVLASACGSSGTTAGLALGAKLAGLAAAVHAYAVCDSPDYFYEEIDGLLQQLGYTEAGASQLFTAHNAKGLGYAISTDEELKTVQEVALATGVLLDPVYSGKALHGLLADVRADPQQWQGKKVLFVHTGGLLGMYDKADQLQPLVEGLGRSSRMDVTAAMQQ